MLVSATAYVRDVPVSMELSNLSMAEARKDIIMAEGGSVLTSSSAVKFMKSDTSEEEASWVLKAAFEDLGSDKFSASLNLMRRKEEAPGLLKRV